MHGEGFDLGDIRSIAMHMSTFHIFSRRVLRWNPKDAAEQARHVIRTIGLLAHTRDLCASCPYLTQRHLRSLSAYTLVRYHFIPRRNDDRPLLICKTSMGPRYAFPNALQQLGVRCSSEAEALS